MQFTDLTFLIVFLPVVLATYYLVKKEYRQIVLILVSIVFYAFGSAFYVLPLFISVLINVGVANRIVFFKNSNKEKTAKRVAALGVIWNLISIIGFRYGNYVISAALGAENEDFAKYKILIPLGLSYYTFKAISYIVDTYKTKTETNAIEGMAYLSLFTQIQSGPISRLDDYLTTKDFSFEMFSNGIVRFMLGFSKKVIISDVLYNVVTEIFDSTSAYSTGMIWLGAITYELYLFFDFSGYSDMAIGIGNMLGISCPENFNFPILSNSFSDFWRRWHITLCSWFRDYIYMPIATSSIYKKINKKARKSFGKHVGQRISTTIPSLFVWVLTGLWHGIEAKYIIWGVLCLVFLTVEQFLKLPDRLKNKISSGIYRIITLVLITITMVIFRANTASAGFDMIKGMFIYRADFSASSRALFLLKDYIVFIAAGLIFSFPVGSTIKGKIEDKKVLVNIYDIVTGLFIILSFVLAMSFIISGQNRPFVYGNF